MAFASHNLSIAWKWKGAIIHYLYPIGHHTIWLEKCFRIQMENDWFYSSKFKNCSSIVYDSDMLSSFHYSICTQQISFYLIFYLRSIYCICMHFCFQLSKSSSHFIHNSLWFNFKSITWTVNDPCHIMHSPFILINEVYIQKHTHTHTREPIKWTKSLKSIESVIIGILDLLKVWIDFEKWHPFHSFGTLCTYIQTFTLIAYSGDMTSNFNEC